MGRLQCGNQVDALGIHLDFDVFEMRFVIGAGVKSDDLHLPVCRRISPEKQGEITYERALVATKCGKSCHARRHEGHRRVWIITMLPNFVLFVPLW